MTLVSNYGLTQQSLNEMNERHQQTLENIKQLQTMEKNLYSSLDTSVSGRTISKSEQIHVIDKINELSQMRSNLFKNLQDMYLFLQSNVADTRSNLVSDITNVGVIEGELNNAKRQLKLLEQEKYNKLRMVEINTYYSDRYKAYTYLMQIIVITCIPLLIIALLAGRGIIPAKVANILMSLVIAVGLIVGGLYYWDISNRDNMNFNEYNWPSGDTDSVDDSDDGDDDDDDDDDDTESTDDDDNNCEGAACCSKGMKYNSKLQKCQDITEAMSCGCMGKANDSVYLNKSNSLVVPFSEFGDDSFVNV